MGMWSKLKYRYRKFKATVQMIRTGYRQARAIWKMFKGAQVQKQSSARTQSNTRATFQNGRTVDVDVIPPRK